MFKKLSATRPSLGKPKSLVLIAISFSFLLSQNSVAQEQVPKLRVIVNEAEDRWITFADGQRIYHGADISYLLSQAVFDDGRFTLIKGPKILNSTTSGSFEIFSEMQGGHLLSETELAERLPKQVFTYDRGGFSTQGLPDMVHIIIKPRLETLLYSSGEKSNRFVAGFSPDRINPFNAGRAGSLDNEFVVPPSNPSTPNAPACQNPDFFRGHFNPHGYGPWKSNFGANADEGFIFEILGFGVGFKKKSYQIKTEIFFDVEYPLLGKKKTFSYSTIGKGRDIFIAGSYQGFSLGLEIQKRKTLRQALAEILPQVISGFTSEIGQKLWQSQIIKVDNGILMDGGYTDGITPDQIFVSNYGSIYTPKSILADVTILSPSDRNTTAPFAGEQLRLWSDSSNPWDSSFRILASNDENVEEGTHVTNKTVELTQTSDPQDLKVLSQRADELCPPKKVGWFERLVTNLMGVYSLYRYHNVFDQPNEEPVGVGLALPKVAIISSGVSPREKALKGFVGAGFDFISWDERPSDDNGAGTAAALYLKQLSEKNFVIVPIKVVGPFGEIHSSELYSAFKYLSSRSDIQFVAVPFGPSVKSLAFEKGVSELVAARKQVVIPEKYFVKGAVAAPEGANSIVYKAMQSKVELSKEGVGVIDRTAQILRDLN